MRGSIHSIPGPVEPPYTALPDQGVPTPFGVPQRLNENGGYVQGSQIPLPSPQQLYASIYPYQVTQTTVQSNTPEMSPAWPTHLHSSYGVRDQIPPNYPRGSMNTHMQSSARAFGPAGSEFQETQGFEFHAPQSTSFHSHGLPSNQGRNRRNSSDKALQDAGYESLVGQTGYPQQRPYVSTKSRFTPEDDKALKFLKEDTSASWKQIAEFFPGRQSGTLQVRYCTKLKPRDESIWTSSAVTKLKRKVRDYDDNKWSEIAKALGPSFSAEECREKAIQLTEGEGVSYGASSSEFEGSPSQQGQQQRQEVVEDHGQESINRWAYDQTYRTTGVVDYHTGRGPTRTGGEGQANAR